MTVADISAPVLVVMGVSGSGKSTVARVLAEQLGWDFQEGDELHPPENVAKMASGVPLTDADRWPWLDRVAAWISHQHEAGRPGVVTCSALRRAYRDRLRTPSVVFVYLAGSTGLLEQRVQARHGHFMPASLLESQLATLEAPRPDEHAVTVELGGSPADEAAAVLTALGYPRRH